MICFLSTLELSGPGSELQRLVEEFSTRKPAYSNDLYPIATVNYLMGNTNGPAEIARLFLRQTKTSAQNSIPEKMIPLVRFFAAEIDEENLFAISRGASAACMASHFVALRHLAAGDRGAARTHFESARNSGANGEIAHILTDFMLKRLEKNPDWPPTIPVRH
jgi:hypothetical protein